jgi:hypothetical protein
VDREFHSIQSNWPPQTKVPAHLDVDSLMEKMAVDKKNKGGRKAVVLLDSIGHVHREEPILVDDEVLARALSDHLAVDPAEQGMANNNRIDRCVQELWLLLKSFVMIFIKKWKVKKIAYGDNLEEGKEAMVHHIIVGLV